MNNTSLRKPPLTLDELINQLQKLREQYPDYATRPVHMLEMDNVSGGLITDVGIDCFDIDCFDDQQGPVTSLMSWASEDGPRDDYRRTAIDAARNLARGLPWP